MKYLSELTDKSKRLAALQICIKNDDLDNRELESLAEWTMPINGVSKPIMAEVLEIRKILLNPDISQTNKIKMTSKITSEIETLKAEGIQPANLVEAEEGKYSKKLIAALSSYLTAVSLQAYQAFNETLHSQNPIIRRGIGYALYEMGSQMASSGTINPKKILSETLEGVTRGASQLIIGQYIPKEYQKAATVMAQGAVRASFFAINNNITKTSSLATLTLGTSTAVALSNYATTKASLPQIAIDTINKSVIKSTIDSLSKKSLSAGIYSFVVTTSRETAYYLSGGTDSLQRREITGIVKGAMASDAVRIITAPFQPKSTQEDAAKNFINALAESGVDLTPNTFSPDFISNNSSKSPKLLLNYSFSTSTNRHFVPTTAPMLNFTSSLSRFIK